MARGLHYREHYSCHTYQSAQEIELPLDAYGASYIKSSMIAGNETLYCILEINKKKGVSVDSSMERSIQQQFNKEFVEYGFA